MGSVELFSGVGWQNVPLGRAELKVCFVLFHFELLRRLLAAALIHKISRQNRAVP